MITAWKIFVDWERNGDFSGTYDNITALVTQANWFLRLEP